MYRAHVYWGCPTHPFIEIETIHEGFASPIRAALFANGCCLPAGPETLHLGADGAMLEFLGKSDVSVRELLAKLVVWQVDRDAPQRLAFVAAPKDDEELAELELEGRYVPSRYAITGPSGPVEVRFTLDRENGLQAAAVSPVAANPPQGKGR